MQVGRSSGGFDISEQSRLDLNEDTASAGEDGDDQSSSGEVVGLTCKPSSPSLGLGVLSTERITPEPSQKGSPLSDPLQLAEHVPAHLALPARRLLHRAALQKTRNTVAGCKLSVRAPS